MAHLHRVEVSGEESLISERKDNLVLGWPSVWERRITNPYRRFV